ncbi:DNA topoisomerase 2-associated protein pat1 [Asimina triloba]
MDKFYHLTQPRGKLLLASCGCVDFDPNRSKGGWGQGEGLHSHLIPAVEASTLVLFLCTGYSSMQTSQKHSSSDGSNSLYYAGKPLQEANSYFSPPKFEPLDGQEELRVRNIHIQTSNEPTFCTLESSPAITPSYVANNSPSTVSFSPYGSPASQQDCQSYSFDHQHSPPDHIYGSPVAGSCITDDANDLKHKLQQLELAMLGPDSDVVNDSFDSKYNASSDLERWKTDVFEIPRGDLKQTLIACARAVEDNDLSRVDWLMTELRQMVSVSGEPMERLGAYLMEGLIARLVSSGSSIYKALRCKEPTSNELLSYMHLLYEACPYFKFGYISANGAIAEAMKDEDRVHIIDFQIAQGSQWVTLMQAFASRPGGPPHLRITGIDDSVSEYARGGGLQLVGKRLSSLAQSLNVPFEFRAAASSGCEVDVNHLLLQPGDAVAVNFAFQLHHMPDESVSTDNHRDRLLRLVKNLSPKLVTLVEQECNTNTAAFFPRFIETLNYYTAMFESLDIALPRDNKERISVEQHCLARDIVNVIACEGVERVERHELFGKWRARFTMAGFRPYPLSSLVNATIKALLQNYCEHYRLYEKDGVLFLGWKERDLVVSCAWSC